MATIVRLEDIETWQSARELSGIVYDLTRHQKLARDFGLCAQMRPASVSIMSNFAEGFESRTNIFFTEFLGRAKASTGELRSEYM